VMVSSETIRTTCRRRRVCIDCVQENVVFLVSTDEFGWGLMDLSVVKVGACIESVLLVLC
jgi:hypothetical protein